jgi:hypothetical protein
MTMSVSLNMRVSKIWDNKLSRLVRVLNSWTKIDRSQLIRRLLVKEASLWLDAPYICTKADHVLLILRNGDVCLRSLETLLLRAARLRLPASLQMKPEKQREIEVRYFDKPDQAGLIRSEWILNHFSAWPDTPKATAPMAQDVDRYGLLTKSCDLEINRAAGERVIRETVVVLRDYVQRREASRLRASEHDPTELTSRDRGGVPIDIPALNLSFLTLLDDGVYEDTLATVAPELDFELRNRESARLQGGLADLEDNPITWVQGRSTMTEREPTLEPEELSNVRETGQRLIDRVRGLAQEDCLAPDGHPVVTKGLDREALRGLTLPAHYQYGKLEWAMPYEGLEVCVTWPKP